MINILWLYLFLDLFVIVSAGPINLVRRDGLPVSAGVFESLEELARIVDISYCVGTSGIQKPFKCLSRCHEFEGFELVTTWNTGPLLSDSCGYIAISHEPFEKRIIVAFRGTYSIANTIADLSTHHAEYVPFLGDDDSNGTLCTDVQPQRESQTVLPQFRTPVKRKSHIDDPACKNCTVHTGFLTSWQNTRCIIVPHVEEALSSYPDYKLVLVGHSLGGAVATLAALEFQARGWTPYVTTFGEPRIGNQALNKYVDERFSLTNSTTLEEAKFRRVTHVDDPVPLLPLEEWGYHMHAGEIFITKSSLPPSREDLKVCDGDEDVRCIAGNGATSLTHAEGFGIPNRYKLWELFFAHRDYFWRLGLCLPGGYPWEWAHEDYEEHEL